MQVRGLGLFWGLGWGAGFSWHLASPSFGGGAVAPLGGEVLPF